MPLHGVATPAEIAKWDPGLTKQLVGLIRPLVKRYFRSEVLGLDLIPPGGVLVVANHSGGLASMDVPVFAIDFYDKFGYDRPLYTLAHDNLFALPTAWLLERAGLIHASRDNAREGAAGRRRGHRLPGR
jgi:1-acyl-sn-glycerol-3-phosphate acyltransferase